MTGPGKVWSTNLPGLLPQDQNQVVPPPGPPGTPGFGSGPSAGSPMPILAGVDTGYVYATTDDTRPVVLSPSAGKTVTYTLLAGYGHDGDSQPIFNTGAGTVVIVIGAGVTVTPTPTGTLTVPAGSWARMDSLDVDSYFFENVVIGAATAPPFSAVLAPVIDATGTLGSGAVFGIAQHGVYSAPLGAAPYGYQWQAAPGNVTSSGSGTETGYVNIAGATAATYTETDPTDQNHSIRLLETGASTDGQSAPIASLGIYVPAAGAVSFAAGYPKIVRDDNGQVAAQVQVGDIVRLDAGPNPPTITAVDVYNPDNSTPATGRQGTHRLPTLTAAPYRYQAVTADSGPGGTGERVYMAVTTSNGAVATVYTVPVTVVAAGSGAGAQRVWGQQPGGPNAPWNRPIMTTATFPDPSDPRVVALREGGNNINCQYYSFPVVYAAAGDPTATVTDLDHGNAVFKFSCPATGLVIPPPSNGDLTSCCVAPTGDYDDEDWQTVLKNLGTLTYTSGYHQQVRIDDSATGFDGGIHAARAGVLFGLIRPSDLGAGIIAHALALGLPNSKMKAGAVLPATGQDSYSNLYTGTIPMGSLVAIPAADQPGGVDVATLGITTPAGLMLAHALQDWGSYVVDSTYNSPMVLVADPVLAGTQELADMQAALNVLQPHLSIVTNNISPNWGGGTVPARGFFVSPGVASSSATAPTRPCPAIGPDLGGIVAFTDSVTTFQWGHTVVGNLLIATFKLPTNLTFDAPKFPKGGVATTMTLAASSSSPAGATSRKVFTYYMLNPDLGNHSLTWANASTNAAWELEMVDVAGVDTTTPFGTPVIDNGATLTELDYPNIMSLATDLVYVTSFARATDAAFGIGPAVPGGQIMYHNALQGTNNLEALTTFVGAGPVEIIHTWTSGADNAAGLALPIHLAGHTT